MSNQQLWSRAVYIAAYFGGPFLCIWALNNLGASLAYNFVNYISVMIVAGYAGSNIYRTGTTRDDDKEPTGIRKLLAVEFMGLSERAHLN